MSRAAAAAALLLTLGLAGCGAGGDGGVETTDGGGAKRVATDPDKHLEFEVATSGATFGGASTVTVRATGRTSDATLKALRAAAQVRVTCEVPGATVQDFPARWDPDKDTASSALVVSGNASAAQQADACTLAIAGATFARVAF